MRFFRELRLIVACIVGSIRSLFWALLALTLVVFTFAFLFSQVCTEHLVQIGDPHGTETEAGRVLKQYFSGVVWTMYVLFQAISGGDDWGNPAGALEPVGGEYQGLFF